MCFQCSQLAESNFIGVDPLQYQNSPCFSTENGDLSGMGLFASLFLSVGFVMGIISTYYFKVKDGGYRSPPSSTEYRGENSNFPEDNI